jgi:hypothetical protein
MSAATSTNMNEASLRRVILGVIAAATPMYAAQACGGTTGSGDGGDDSGSDVWCPCCSLPPPVMYTVTYEVCSTSTDAGADTGGDAEAGVADAGVCYASCYQACEMNTPPNNMGGVGGCLEDIDGGDAGGVRTAQCQIEHFCGRRLEGLLETTSADATAHAAWLEAASVHAFQRLARELEAHGAPDELVERARECARDEARHARIMARIAKRRGARVPSVIVRDVAGRDLESVARENAIEACVGETFGALQAEWSARHEPDAELGAAMRSIAPDELRHAALGWDVAAWADGQLDAPARDRVREARQTAVATLMREAQSDPQSAKLAYAMKASGIWV